MEALALPKIQSPLFDVVIPSTDKTIKFRPFLGKEEKILLMAQQGREQREILNAMVQIVNNCAQGALNIEKLTLVDLEYIFLKLRGFSIENNIDVGFIDSEDDKTYKFTINIDDIKVVKHDDNEPKIEIDETNGIIMKQPDVKTAYMLLGLTEDQDYMTLVYSIDKIYDADKVYLGKDYPKEDLLNFLESLDLKTHAKLKKFFNTLPTLYYKIEYKNSLGSDRTIELRTLEDFFI